MSGRSPVYPPDRPVLPATSVARQPQSPVVLDAAQLFAGRDEIRLLHRGQEYRLRVTRQGKLILTK